MSLIASVVAKDYHHNVTNRRAYQQAVFKNKNLIDIISGICYFSEEINNWRKCLRDEEDSSLVEVIKREALTGRHCVDNRFVAGQEGKFKRQLHPLAHGRTGKDIRLAVLTIIHGKHLVRLFFSLN